jgi:integrase
MPVRKTKNGRWAVDFRHQGKRIRYTSTATTKRDAEADERTARSRLALGLPLVPTEKAALPLFRDFFEQWYNDYVVGNNGISSQRTKRIAFRVSLKPFFGARRLDDITSQDVERFKGWMLKKGYKHKTLNNRLTILRRCLGSALEWGLLEKVPSISAVRVPEPPWDYLSEAEAADLLKAALTIEGGEMVWVALRAGLRRGELQGLHWEDIDESSRHIIVRRNVVQGRDSWTKTHRTRFIPASHDLWTALKRREREGPRMFPGPQGGIISVTRCQTILNRACRAAGIRRVRWHDLRHTFASHLVARGVHLLVVARLLGHTTTKMTERYAHLAPNACHAAIDALTVPPTTSLTRSLPDISAHFGQHMVIGSANQKSTTSVVHNKMLELA